MGTGALGLWVWDGDRRDCGYELRVEIWGLGGWNH